MPLRDGGRRTIRRSVVPDEHIEVDLVAALPQKMLETTQRLVTLINSQNHHRNPGPVSLIRRRRCPVHYVWLFRGVRPAATPTSGVRAVAPAFGSTAT